MANIAHKSSVMRELDTPKKLAKAPKNLPLKSLARPPQADGSRFLEEAPSQFILIQLQRGGFQMTSTIFGAQGG